MVIDTDKIINQMDIKKRYTLLEKKWWTFQQIKDFSGIDLSIENNQGTDNTTLLGQYRIWAERYRETTDVLDIANSQVSKYLLDMFLQERDNFSQAICHRQSNDGGRSKKSFKKS
jgi:hypothetical protein